MLWLEQVIVTERAGHAFDVMRSTTDEELKLYDGVLGVVSDEIFSVSFLCLSICNEVEAVANILGSWETAFIPHPEKNAIFVLYVHVDLIHLLNIFQGGDGFFNEILNGLLSTRHKASYPPAPADFLQSLGGNNNFSVDEPASEIFSHDEDEHPLIPNKVLGISSIGMYFFHVSY